MGKMLDFTKPHLLRGEEEYEAAVEEIDRLLDLHGMTRADLAELLGGRSRVSEFFSGKRPLSLGQARSLQVRFGLSLDALLGVKESGGTVGYA